MISLAHTVKLNPHIQDLLAKFVGLETALTHLAPPTEALNRLRRQHLLHSAIYSARIEGNSLSPDTFSQSPQDLEKLEIQNLLDTYTWLSQQSALPLDLDLIKTLHKKSLHNLHANAGHFRSEQSAVFNSTGIAIYLTPPPQDIEPLLTTWLKQFESPLHHPVIQNIIAHYQFEKIHPFLDGNGRVGRLLFTLVLKNLGYQYADLLALEQGLEQSRSEYYHHLNDSSKDLTNFTEYLLELITAASETVLIKLKSPTQTATHSSLPPRRQEIYLTIRDHSPCSADFLYRRFLAVPQSTIRYDLKRLQAAGLITKLGTTRGALYQAN